MGGRLVDGRLGELRTERAEIPLARRRRASLFALGARVLSKYGTDDCGYEDHCGEQEQSTDDPFVQGAAAMLTARVVFGGSHLSDPIFSAAGGSERARPDMASGRDKRRVADGAARESGWPRGLFFCAKKERRPTVHAARGSGRVMRPTRTDREGAGSSIGRPAGTDQRARGVVAGARAHTVD